MTKTTNYQLNQWAKSDRVMMDDFNADNTKIDAALKANADTAAANTQTLAAQAQTIAKLGNCKVVAGSYTGDGTYGADHAITLNFSHKPMLVIIQDSQAQTTCRLFLQAGCSRSFAWHDGNAQNMVVTWGTTSVSWFHYQSDEYQMNRNKAAYSYVAFLAAD